jgi:TatA/E family protein of Tat protein translocase
MGFFGIGPGELVVIMVLALLIFGPGKLPETARALGKTVREFKKYSSSLTKDFKGEFEKELKTSPAEAKKDAVKNDGQPSEDKEPEAVTSPSKDEGRSG